MKSINFNNHIKYSHAFVDQPETTFFNAGNESEG